MQSSKEGRVKKYKIGLGPAAQQEANFAIIGPQSQSRVKETSTSSDISDAEIMQEVEAIRICENACSKWFPGRFKI